VFELCFVLEDVEIMVVGFFNPELSGRLHFPSCIYWEVHI
jgi:hypothetical protein